MSRNVGRSRRSEVQSGQRAQGSTAMIRPTTNAAPAVASSPVWSAPGELGRTSSASTSIPLDSRYMKADRRPAKRVDAASSITLLYRRVSSPLDRYLPVSGGDANSLEPIKIEHLALAVRDPEASRAFYLETIGLDASAREMEWGIQLDFPDGFL